MLMMMNNTTYNQQNNIVPNQNGPTTTNFNNVNNNNPNYFFNNNKYSNPSLQSNPNQVSFPQSNMAHNLLSQNNSFLNSGAAGGGAVGILPSFQQNINVIVNNSNLRDNQNIPDDY
jgi:hypothetical protein